jgi:hypothetical protein
VEGNIFVHPVRPITLTLSIGLVLLDIFDSCQFQHDPSTRTTTQRRQNRNHHAMAQDAIMTIQHAFDAPPQKSEDFMDILATAAKTRLSCFVSNEYELSSIEQYLFHFRNMLLTQQQLGVHGGGMDAEMARVKALPLLKSAIEKLHFALNDDNHGICCCCRTRQ